MVECWKLFFKKAPTTEAGSNPVTELLSSKWGKVVDASSMSNMMMSNSYRKSILLRYDGYHQTEKVQILPRP